MLPQSTYLTWDLTIGGNGHTIWKGWKWHCPKSMPISISTKTISAFAVFQTEPAIPCRIRSVQWRNRFPCHRPFRRLHEPVCSAWSPACFHRTQSGRRTTADGRRWTVSLSRTEKSRLRCGISGISRTVRVIHPHVVEKAIRFYLDRSPNQTAIIRISVFPATVAGKTFFPDPCHKYSGLGRHGRSWQYYRYRFPQTDRTDRHVVYRTRFVSPGTDRAAYPFRHPVPDHRRQSGIPEILQSPELGHRQRTCYAVSHNYDMPCDHSGETCPLAKSRRDQAKRNASCICTIPQTARNTSVSN